QEAGPKIDDDQTATLFVQTAGIASFSETRLWLEKASPQTAWRASDREPGAGMVSTESFVSLWEQEDIFAAQPLTAQFTCTVNGEAVNYLIELLAPKFYDGFWRGELSPSHNLVVGPYHTYSQAGGLVAGFNNTTSGSYASVTGGSENIASESRSSITGGRSNEASGTDASVSGGFLNKATADRSSASGGRENQALNTFAWTGGGYRNKASGLYAAVSGGESNDASGIKASISGGGNNEASGGSSSINGGYLNET
ncbi:MAG TPA: hypothetical protein DCG06_05910, partial [Deltaproteobacteria bacterium]|nr:hypothetical protein [Deltaproteobacteria bacterium]